MEEDAAAVRAAALRGAVSRGAVSRGAVSRGAAPSATAEASHIEAALCIEAERSFDGVVTTAVVTTPAPAILTTSIAEAAAITAAASIAAAPCIGAEPCIAAERLPEAEQDEEFVLLAPVADVVADITSRPPPSFPVFAAKASCIPGKSARGGRRSRATAPDNPTVARLSRDILKPSRKRRWVQWQ
jgi:hypothetical protein